ncbi:MAG: hypothetical protein WC211_02450 [Dehalococcoidia bacterium]
MGLVNSLLLRLRGLASPAGVVDVLAGRHAVTTELALAIALVSMFGLGLGGWLWWWMTGMSALNPEISAWTVFVRSALFGTAVSFGLWLGWLLVAFAVMQRVTGAAVPMERLLREAGLATVPLALGVLMVIPYLSFGIGVAVIGAWAASMQGALERATGQRGASIVLANLLGLTLWAGVLSLLGSGGNVYAPGPFLAHSVWEFVATRLASQAVR